MELFLAILQFVFRDFWTWAGFAVLLVIVFLGIGEILRAIRGKGIGSINAGINVSGALSDITAALAKAKSKSGGTLDGAP